MRFDGHIVLTGNTETVVEGVTGYRCRSLKQFVRAAEVAPVLGMAPHAVARHMTRHYDVATMPGGWLREQFDCHVRRDRERAPSTAPLVWTEIKPSRDHPL